MSPTVIKSDVTPQWIIETEKAKLLEAEHEVIAAAERLKYAADKLQNVKKYQGCHHIFKAVATFTVNIDQCTKCGMEIEF